MTVCYNMKKGRHSRTRKYNMNTDDWHEVAIVCYMKKTINIPEKRKDNMNTVPDKCARIAFKYTKFAICVLFAFICSSFAVCLHLFCVPFAFAFIQISLFK